MGRLTFGFVVFLFILILWLGGCAGNGQGLDQNGNPIGNDGGLPIAFEPTFTNVQQNVFSAICVECHTGPDAPQGMSLDPDHSYQNIVGVHSNEQPNLFRVAPGDPNDSYLIHKLEGGPNIVGGQMPLDRTPLSQETINSIRLWIAQGAPKN